MDKTIRLDSTFARGDPPEAERLLPLVYDELRTLASRRLVREGPGQSLEATALVHEAYLRLVGGGAGRLWDGRRHFFAAAAEAMRRILVDRAATGDGSSEAGGSGESTSTCVPSRSTSGYCQMSLTGMIQAASLTSIPSTNLAPEMTA